MSPSGDQNNPVFVTLPEDRLYGSAEGPGMFLIELLETYPHYLGDQEHVGDLPFMFKVLSINKALSIQVGDVSSLWVNALRVIG